MVKNGNKKQKGMIMKKSMWMMAVLVLVGASAFGMSVKETSATFSNVTTNDTVLDSADLSVVGSVFQVVLDVSAATAIDIDIVDSTTGVTIYSADAVAADVVLFPSWELTDSAGAGTTNYISPFVAGLTVKAGDAAATNQNLTVKVIYKKE